MSAAGLRITATRYEKRGIRGFWVSSEQVSLDRRSTRVTYQHYPTGAKSLP